MTYDEMITALENIILDRVMTTPGAARKIDTSGPLHLGTAAKDDASDAKSEERADKSRE